jgi:predicted metal-dependent peptidase
MVAKTKSKLNKPKINIQTDDEIRERIVQSRVRLLLKHPFFGNLATRLILKNADDFCPTAATDGRHFYYNREFITPLTSEELDFLVGHEVLHCVFDHMDRREGRQPEIWNMATDYVINGTLVRESLGKMPKQGLHDPKYYDKNSDEIYSSLKKNAVEIKVTLDMHMDGEGQGKQGQGQGEDDKSKNKMPVMSKAEKDKLKDEVKNAVLQAAQAAGAGNVPKGVERLIKNVTEPKMDWRTLLDQHITSVVKSDYTFMRPSRKGWTVDAILPGLQPEPAVDVCVAIDTSGSISDKQLQIFLGEVKGIMDSFHDYKIHVWSFDTEVHNPEVFTPDKDLTDYKPGGFGGTEFTANWEWMKEEGVQPKKLIVFTDGYPWGSWGDDNYCDTLWIIHSNHDKELEAPFGITCHYDEV